ncbi:MAG: cyclic nucleotide-binding domain-containing protein [Rhodobacterales bacterium]|nr:cyclic nucleotide-binding domain-containing protein [Rhodobacterales bacterium]
MIQPGRVDSVAVLRGSPLFKGVPDSILGEVAQHFYPVAARRGHFLCTEGESGNDMFILRGVVVATHQTHRFERLATLEPGDAFGMCALIQSDCRRIASCICREQMVGLSMGRITWAELICRNDTVGSVLRTAIIRALADQLAYANAQFSLFDMRR